MEKKILILFATICAAIFAVQARNDLILGQVHPNQILLYSHTHNVTGIPNTIVSNNFYFFSPLRNITLFRALDQNVNGTGGFASVIAGGIGQRNITYNLRASAAGRGFNFYVDIYGV